MVEERMRFLEGTNKRCELREGRTSVRSLGNQDRLVPVPLDSFLLEPGHSDVPVDLRQVQTHSHQFFLPSDPEELELQESSLAEGGPVGSSGAPSQARGHKPEGRPLPDGACESS